MSQENVDIVRRCIELNRSGASANIEVLTALTDPDFEFGSAFAAVEGEVYRGHDGIRRYLDDMADSWREWHNDLESIEEVVPGTVLVSFTFHAIGSESGVAIQARSIFIFVVSDRKLVRAHGYATRAEALEAVGLSE